MILDADQGNAAQVVAVQVRRPERRFEFRVGRQVVLALDALDGRLDLFVGRLDRQLLCALLQELLLNELVQELFPGLERIVAGLRRGDRPVVHARDDLFDKLGAAGGSCHGGKHREK